jgi:hypothetical protein
MLQECTEVEFMNNLTVNWESDSESTLKPEILGIHEQLLWSTLEYTLKVTVLKKTKVGQK